MRFLGGGGDFAAARPKANKKGFQTMLFLQILLQGEKYEHSFIDVTVKAVFLIISSHYYIVEWLEQYQVY